MLEVNYSGKSSSFSFSVFPKTALFFSNRLKSDEITSALLSKKNFFHQQKVKNFYRFYQKSVLNIIPNESIFSPHLTAMENLQFLAKCFENEYLLMAFIKHFKISFLDLQFHQLSSAEKKILCFAPFFLKESYIWQIFIDDEVFSSTQIESIKQMMISKTSNSNSIIFYQTATGKHLEISNQISIS